jgi:hypothetical protein
MTNFFIFFHIRVVTTKPSRGNTTITELLNRRAEVRSPCNTAEIARVMPHPGHSKPKKCLNMQRSGKLSIKEVGRKAKRTGITKYPTNFTLRIQHLPATFF